MPKSPRHYKCNVQDMQDKASPRKKALFAASASVSKEAAAVGDQVTQSIAELKSQCTKEANAERMFLINDAANVKSIGSSIRAQAKAIGVHRKTLKTMLHITYPSNLASCQCHRLHTSKRIFLLVISCHTHLNLSYET